MEHISRCRSMDVRQKIATGKNSIFSTTTMHTPCLLRVISASFDFYFLFMLTALWFADKHHSPKLTFVRKRITAGVVGLSGRCHNASSRTSSLCRLPRGLTRDIRRTFQFYQALRRPSRERWIEVSFAWPLGSAVTRSSAPGRAIARRRGMRRQSSS